MGEPRALVRMWGGSYIHLWWLKNVMRAVGRANEVRSFFSPGVTTFFFFGQRSQGRTGTPSYDFMKCWFITHIQWPRLPGCGRPLRLPDARWRRPPPGATPLEVQTGQLRREEGGRRQTAGCRLAGRWAMQKQHPGVLITWSDSRQPSYTHIQRTSQQQLPPWLSLLQLSVHRFQHSSRTTARYHPQSTHAHSSSSSIYTAQRWMSKSEAGVQRKPHSKAPRMSSQQGLGAYTAPCQLYSEIAARADNRVSGLGKVEQSRAQSIWPFSVLHLLSQPTFLRRTLTYVYKPPRCGAAR